MQSHSVKWTSSRSIFSALRRYKGVRWEAHALEPLIANRRPFYRGRLLGKEKACKQHLLVVQPGRALVLSQKPGCVCLDTGCKEGGCCTFRRRAEAAPTLLSGQAGCSMRDSQSAGLQRRPGRAR